MEYINQTLIGMWTRCPEQVRRRYIEGETIPPGIAARIGTGVHKGAEVNHLAKIVSGKDEPLSVIQDAARDGYVKSIQDGVFFPPDKAASARKEIAEGVDTTVTLATLYGTSAAPKIKPAIVEKTITMAVDGIDRPFIGTVDVYTVDRWMPDLKTGAKKWPQSRADSSAQFTLYNELIRHETGEYPTRLSAEVFTKTKEPAHQSLETTRCPEDFDALIKRVHVMMRMIDAGIFPPADPDSWMCQMAYCGYFLSCPYIASHRKTLPKRSA